MKIGTFLFAENVRAVDGGRYVAFNIYAGNVIFETLESAKLPVSSILLTLFDVDEGSYNLAFRIINHTSKRAVNFGAEEFVAQKPRTSITFEIHIDDLFFPAPGVHELQVLVGEEVIGAHEFKVDILDYVPSVEPKPKKKRVKKLKKVEPQVDQSQPD